MFTHDIIVIGTSAGGVQTLMQLVHTFSPNLLAAIFVVLHIPPDTPSLIPQILNRSGPLKATQANDGETIEYQHIYVAPPDHHLRIESGLIRVTSDPKKQYYRPAIDHLFHSAALAYGPRVVGVLLTGVLEDGTAGLLVIKQHGGTTVVQDPAEALYPDMPTHALEHVEIDYCLPIAGIGALLRDLTSQPIQENTIAQHYQGLIYPSHIFHTQHLDKNQE